MKKELTKTIQARNGRRLSVEPLQKHTLSGLLNSRASLEEKNAMPMLTDPSPDEVEL